MKQLQSILLALITLTFLAATAAAAEPAEQTWRLELPRGVVRVFAPAGYDAETAGTVLYVHGYHRTPDWAWDEGGLPDQLRASGLNALFILPQGPEDDWDGNHFSRLGPLLAELEAAGITVPGGPMVAIGHSGGFRPIAGWVDDPRLDEVILLDGLYGGVKPFTRFARHGRLVLVSLHTVGRARRLFAQFRGVVAVDDVPASEADFTPEAREARLLHLGTHLGHAEISDSGEVIPVLLRRTRLPLLTDVATLAAR